MAFSRRHPILAGVLLVALGGVGEGAWAREQGTFGIMELGNGLATCAVDQLPRCLEDPRAGELRELFRRLSVRKTGSWDLVGTWILSEAGASDGRPECLVPYAASERWKPEIGPNLQKAATNASQVVRLEVQKIRTVLGFEPNLDPGPDDPVYVGASTFVDAVVVSFRSRGEHSFSALPGELVWLFEPDHDPIEIAGHLLFPREPIDPILAGVNPGDTLFLLPQLPQQGFQRGQASRPDISVDSWENVVVFSPDGDLKHLPAGLADAKVSGDLSPASFEQLVEDYLAPGQNHQPRGWRMLADKAAFCPVAELETCLDDNGGPLLGLLDFHRRMPERFWVGWNESCVRPPLSVPELSPIPLGAEAHEAISSSRSIIAGRVREVTVGFFAPDLGNAALGVQIYTMIVLEDMDVLKHTRLVLGPANSSANPLRSGTFVLLAPVGSARLGEVELCSRDPTNTPPFDVLVPGDQIILFSRDGLTPAAWGPGALFAETWTPGELAVFDASGTKKFNSPPMQESERAEGASDFEALVALVAESGEDR